MFKQFALLKDQNETRNMLEFI